MAAASSPAWRMLNASMIWEKPRNNAKNPTQNKAQAGPLGQGRHPVGPDTQQLAVEYALPAAMAAATGIGLLRRGSWAGHGGKEAREQTLIACSAGHSRLRSPSP
jgi:hypothetical protein